MATSQMMRSSTPRLSEAARHVCAPQGIVSTGWPAVRETCRRMCVGFDRWQEGLGSLILSKRRDGQYAAGVGGVVLSIPRQTGKTYTVGWIVYALAILNPGLTVIWTAHRTRTASETFQQMRTMARNPRVAPLIEAVRATNGEQAVVFKNGSRILFGARESGFGRGFAKVDILVLDEGQILTEDAMSDMVPATNAAPNGLVLLMGTPPRPKDNGEVFRNRRRDALDGDPDTLYVEFSADNTCDPTSWAKNHVDWDQLGKANPSFPHRTSKQAILRMKKLLGSPENFKREALGIWDEEGARRGIPADLWDGCAVESGPEDGVRSFAVTFSKDGSRQALAGAVKTEAGVHLEVIDAYSGPAEAGVSSVADWLAKRRDLAAAIVLCGNAGATVLAEALRDRGLRNVRQVHVMTTPEYTTACAMLLEWVRDGSVTHPRVEDPTVDALESSVAVCDRMKRGQSGAWGWVSTTEDGDETPIEAVSCALWAAKTTNRVPGRKQEVMA